MVNIDFTDLASRLNEVPAAAGNYSSLQATEKRLCWLQRDEDDPPKLGRNAWTLPTRATRRIR